MTSKNLINNVNIVAANNIANSNENRTQETQSNLESKDANIGESQILDEECFNEDVEESEFCEEISSVLNPYSNKNILPFPLYMKDSFPIIFEALVELERIRPKDPVEFFSVYLIQKQEALNKQLKKED